MSGLRSSGIALGGLGTGSVEFRADGYLHEWQIMNNRPWGAGPRANVAAYSGFFGMQVTGKNHCRSLILGEVPHTASAWGVKEPSSLAFLEYPTTIEADVKVPFTHLSYDFAASVPVTVDMEAFSPFIPLDEKNSGLPLAYFTFNVTNVSDHSLKVTLFGALPNVVGYADSETPSTMTAETGRAAGRMNFSRNGLDADRSDGGGMTVGYDSDVDGKSCYVFHPFGRDLWDPLRATGELENMDRGEFVGQIGNMGAARLARMRQGTPHGVLGHTMTLEAGQSATVRFSMSWFFPNHKEADYNQKSVTGTIIGHRYAEWFDSSDAVFDYGRRHAGELRKETMAFVDGYYQSSYPRWFLDVCAAQLTTLIKASWWDRSGRFGIWEGLGCCGLQTTDITYYGSFPILQLFPGIEKSQMRLSRDAVETAGCIPHMMPGTFGCCDVDHRKRIDLIPQFVLLVWRDVLWTGDMEYLQGMWPTIKEAMKLFEKNDTDGDGLPNNTGPDQTYDQFPLKGTSSFVGYLYLAAIRATRELGELMEDDACITDMTAMFDHCRPLLDEQLWNGSYYRLCYDPVDGVADEGVMADQLNGDWFTRQTTGRRLLPDDKVRSSLESILRHCRKPQGYLTNCAWPNTSPVTIGRHTADQANWPWTGVEFAVAAHLVMMGMTDEGLAVAKDVWTRHETLGLRFNHFECGTHYYRALSSWAVYLAMTGFNWNALTRRLEFGVGEDARFAIYLPTGWATVTVAGDDVTMTVERGTMELSELNLKGCVAKSGTVELNGSSVPWEFTGHGESSCVAGSVIKLSQGDRLRVTICANGAMHMSPVAKALNKLGV